MSRARKPHPGRIMIVGAGPSDPALLTRRARRVLSESMFVVTDADVDEDILALVGTARSGGAGSAPPAAAEKASDAADGSGAGGASSSRGAAAVADSADGAGDAPPAGPTIQPALGEPADVAKTMVAEAKRGDDVVRLVSGDPMTTDAVITEITAIARTQVRFEIIPGVPAGSAVPAYAGIPIGSERTEVDVRGDVDWAGLAAAPGTLVLHATSARLAETASALAEHGVPGSTPAAITVGGTTRRQRTVEATLATLDEVGSEMVGPLIVTIGKVVGQRHKMSWWESRALYGWTVLVPRTKAQAASMSDRLVSHGAIPKEVPTISVEPPRSPAQMERAIKGLVDGRFQWVVFTSANAVKAVWEKFIEFGLDARAFSGVKIACVGQATADRVRAFGIEPEMVPRATEQTSEGLLAEFPPFDEVLDPVNRVLLPRADIATETISEGLGERGWEIDDVTAYRTVRASPPPAETREMIKTGGFDAVCFTSSSTVRNLVGIAGKPHARTIIACIGPKTAETAREFGLRVDVQPETAQALPLVEALAEHAARLRAEGALPPPRKKSRRR